MKISIVTISYNQGGFLERAIKSVIEQDYDDIEYIIVDPGSTDGSRDIIERYRSRIAKVIFEPDKGPSDGLNKGFALATGDVFGFLNSDDILLKNALSKVSRFFKSHPEIDVISGHSLIIDEHEKEIRKSYSDPFSLHGYAYRSVTLMQASTFFRAARFKCTQWFNVINRSAWDGELFVDLSLSGAKFALIDEFLSGFRLHSQSITASKRLEEAYREYREYIFRKIMGRDTKQYDVAIKYIFKLFKYIRNPRNVRERLLRGPIYGRKSGF